MDNKCKVEGCEGKMLARGYCNKHYKQFSNQGIFDKDIEDKKHRKCSVPGCDRPYYGKGYCSMHYKRVRKHDDSEYEFCEFHAMSLSPEYGAWTSMKQRCYNKKNKGYDNYGGRGIVMCNRWKDSFNNFLEDMGLKPNQDMEIDRANNDGNYDPNNCKWVTREKNMRNRRSTLLTMAKARAIRERLTRGERNSDLAIEYGCSISTITEVKQNKTWKEEDNIQRQI